MRRTILPALLASAALVPGIALAQMDSESDSGMPYDCQQLQTYADGNQVADSELNSEQILLISQYNDEQACRDALQVVSNESSMTVGSDNYDEALHQRMNSTLENLEGSAGIGEQGALDDGEPIEAEQFATMSTRSEAATDDVARESHGVDEIVGLTVFGADGEEVGDVEDIARDGAGTYVIIGSGGFFGFGQTDVALSLDDVTLSGQALRLRDYTQEEVQQMQQVDASNFTMIDRGEQVDVRVQ